MKSITRARSAMLMTIGLTLAASACDDTSATDPILGDGAYRLEIEGDVARTLTGEAFFGAEEDENGESIFAITFGSETADDIVMVGVSGITRPSAGSYEIEIGEVGEGDWVGLYVFGNGDELEGFLVADSGSVVLSESSTEVIKGSILLYLSGFIEGEVGEVVVEGDFDARPALSES